MTHKSRATFTVISAIAGFCIVMILHEVLVVPTSPNNPGMTGPTVSAQTQPTLVNSESTLTSSSVDVVSNQVSDASVAEDPLLHEGVANAEDTTELVSAAPANAEPFDAGANEALSNAEPALSVNTANADQTKPAMNGQVSSLEQTKLIWSAVWRPFFSRATATGFSDYISDATGLPLRVRESEVAGQYLVEVSHLSEADRLAADRLIVETTGYQPVGAIR